MLAKLVEPPNQLLDRDLPEIKESLDCHYNLRAPWQFGLYELVHNVLLIVAVAENTKLVGNTMPEMLISDALICDLDLKRVTNMLSATRVNTTRHWYAVAYGK